ncbi:MAG: LamG domain-containing protein, partial [Planctomycetota bacterium]
ADVVTEPCDANLVGHWTLDGDPCDSSSYDHNSTIWGKYKWATGHNYDISPTDGAVKFTGTGSSRGGRIVVDDNDILRPKYAVTASAWVYFTEGQDDGRVVVKGKNDKETYAIEVDNLDEFKFKVRDPCGKEWDVGDDKERLYPGEWIHVAGTYDGDSNTVKAYVNAELIDSRKDANFVEGGLTLSQDTNDLAIGAQPETTKASSGDPFIGSIDEVRVYNYALDANEIAWLATDGTGYRRLRSQANFYDLEMEGEKAVNFRDLAVMIAEYWLDEKKWP